MDANVVICNILVSAPTVTQKSSWLNKLSLEFQSTHMNVLTINLKATTSQSMVINNFQVCAFLSAILLKYITIDEESLQFGLYPRKFDNKFLDRH